MADDWLGINGTHYDSSCGQTGEATVISALNGTHYWYHEVNEVHWFILDLGQTYTIKKLKARSKFAYDPTDVNIYIDDSNPPTTLIESGISVWQNTSDFVEVDITDSDGRYIKVEIADTEHASNYLLFGIADAAPFNIFDVYGDVAGGVAHEVELSETLSLSESLKHDIGVKISETLGLSETIATQSEFYVALSETLALSESIKHGIGIHLSETLDLSESLAMDIAINLVDTLNLAETLASEWTINVALTDTLELSESLKHDMGVYLSDTLDLSEDAAAELIEAIVKILRKRYIAGLKPARVVKVGRIGM